ncbi:DUF2235 domain-containing protein [Amaricoccus tamworthensis]|uniref:DUF2235 domain-containing protein n=1 Tax=Amaricoccus tamworthensis TaxID=57002 RepID=UPI003C7BFD62
MANLVVCADGTWQTPDDEESGVSTASNVSRLVKSLGDTDNNGLPQKCHYITGIGAGDSFVQRLTGGGLGLGLSEDIREGYLWLAKNYTPGDRIYLFGFSRGAYTVRSLAGMISGYGLLDLTGPDLNEDERDAQVRRIFNMYRSQDDAEFSSKLSFFNTPAGSTGRKQTPVHFLGVWDTVGSLGIPDDLGFLNVLDNPAWHAFHDTELSNVVAHARHALAMDEQRQSFTPTFWTGLEEHRDVKQIWFPGVHGDVGGGYPEPELSNISLRWMMREAADQELAFRPDAEASLGGERPDGFLHDSLSGVFKKLKTCPRAVPLFGEGMEEASVHPAAVARKAAPPAADPDYWVHSDLAVGHTEVTEAMARPRWNRTPFYLRAGETYNFRASGQWTDGLVTCGPGGTDDGDFQPGEIAHVAGTGLGLLERLFRKVTGNTETDFLLTRRHEEFSWFSLVGVVANNAGDGGPGSHETFEIGNGVTGFTPSADGFLYVYANDAWQTYGNNSGSLELKITRTG